MSTLEHGRSGWLHNGCRCATCHRALLDYSRTRLAAQVWMRGAEPASRVNPARVRRHIDELKGNGWTLSGIARAAGVNRTTVDRIAHGYLEHCSRITARLTLAVEP